MPYPLLRPDSLVASNSGVFLELCLPWYRSLPLSCLEALTIVINGDEIDLSDTLVTINGKSRHFSELAQIGDETWFIQDRCRVPIANTPGPVLPGDHLDVTARLDARIPYILTGPTSALIINVTATENLEATDDRRDS